MTKLTLTLAFAATSMIAGVTAVHSAPAVGLKGDKTLVWFDTDKP